MTLNAGEREVFVDLIRAVQTLAQQILTVHLQLGAVRAHLARKGIVTESEVRTALSELGAVSSAGELLGTIPTTEEFFANLLRRLQEADNRSSQALEG
jgi:hypothetical protein